MFWSPMPVSLSQGDEGPPGPRGPPSERVREVKRQSVSTEP